jgi:hypothetical protein
MIGFLICLLLGLAAIRLGLKGFSSGGLALSGNKTLSGGVAKTIGGVLLVFGFAVLLIAVMLARTALKVK